MSKSTELVIATKGVDKHSTFSETSGTRFRPMVSVSSPEYHLSLVHLGVLFSVCSVFWWEKVHERARQPPSILSNLRDSIAIGEHE